MINITYIYLVENCFNDPNKVYIGKTKNPRNRKWDHQKTYGKNIIYNVIDQIESLEHKIWKPIETMWIQSFVSWGFDVINPRKEGGSGSSEWPEASKKKQSEKYKNRDVPWAKGMPKGYKYTEEQKQKMRKPRKNKWEREKLLTENQVMEIRNKYTQGQRICDLSREYNVSWGTTKNVVEKLGGYK